MKHVMPVHVMVNFIFSWIYLSVVWSYCYVTDAISGEQFGMLVSMHILEEQVAGGMIWNLWHIH